MNVEMGIFLVYVLMGRFLGYLRSKDRKIFGMLKDRIFLALMGRFLVYLRIRFIYVLFKDITNFRISMISKLYLRFPSVSVSFSYFIFFSHFSTVVACIPLPTACMKH